MKIAIIGTGISGLSAAHLLAKGNELSLFEANDYIGGHTNTLQINETESCLAVDTGFIVFNETNYPNLTRLFTKLGVESRDSDMSFSVKCEATGLEYNGTSMHTLFAQKSNILNLRFLWMLKDIMNFHKQGPASLANDIDDNINVADYVSRHRYSNYFLEKYLVPLGASLWSCPAEKFKQFPMRFVLEFLDNHCMLQVNGRPTWKTVVGGSSAYIDKLIAPFSERIFLRSPVKSVIRNEHSVTVALENGQHDEFDEVIMACHADQSLRLRANCDAEERELLEQFEYQYNETVLHTDTRLLPENRLCWASWNYRIPEAPTAHTQVTYNMNILQGLESDNTYCVSLNQTESIRPDRVIRKIGYHHPVFKPGRSAAQQQHSRMIRRKRISYCGAYWGYGFHEDGIKSGLAVASAFGREFF